MPNPDSVLNSGGELQEGDSITSSNSQYTLIQQTDGALVLYDSAWRALWSNNQSGTEVARTVMQRDGDLVSYSSSGAALWSSRTHGNPGAFLVVQDDGDLVLHNANRVPVWGSSSL